MNKPLRVVLWELALGLILAGSLIAAIWVFATQSGLEFI